MNEMKVGNVFLPGLEVLFLVRSGLTSASQPNQSHLLFTQILGTVLEFIYWYLNVSTCSSCIMQQSESGDSGFRTSRSVVLVTLQGCRQTLSTIGHQHPNVTKNIDVAHKSSYQINGF